MEQNEQSHERICNDRIWYGDKGIHYLLEKYFLTLPIIVINNDPADIDEEELLRMLQEYDLGSHFELFKDLTRWLPKIIELCNEQNSILTEGAMMFNEIIELLLLAEAMKNKTFSWMEIKPNRDKKIKITSPEIIEMTGSLILRHFENNPKYYNENQLKPKIKKKRWKQNSRCDLAAIYHILIELFNKENILKAEGVKFISNEQGRLIVSLFEISNVIEDKKKGYYNQDYILSLLKNFENKDPSLKFVL